MRMQRLIKVEEAERRRLRGGEVGTRLESQSEDDQALTPCSPLPLTPHPPPHLTSAQPHLLCSRAAVFFFVVFFFFFLPTNSSAAVGDKHTGPEGGFLCYLIFSVFPPSSRCHRGTRHKLAAASVFIFTSFSSSAVRRRTHTLVGRVLLLAGANLRLRRV